MSDLPTRLRSLFGGEAARSLAHYAPQGLLAISSGAVIGAIIASPEFATAGWGIVLGSLAANVTSSLLERLAFANDDERAALLKDGLEQQNPEVTTVVAAALTHAGPTVAQALPDTTRTELVAGLERAMREAGGPLAAIAARYSAALQDKDADWAAVQAALRQTITTHEQVVEVQDRGKIRDIKQEITNPADTTRQVVRAGNDSEISGVTQTVSNAQPKAVPATRRCPDCGAAVPAAARSCPSCGLPLAGEPAAPAHSPLNITFVQGDQNNAPEARIQAGRVQGDAVAGDKAQGDKVEGDKHEQRNDPA